MVLVSYKILKEGACYGFNLKSKLSIHSHLWTPVSAGLDSLIIGHRNKRRLQSRAAARRFSVVRKVIGWWNWFVCWRHAAQRSHISIVYVLLYPVMLLDMSNEGFQRVSDESFCPSLRHRRRLEIRKKNLKTARFTIINLLTLNE